MNNFKYYAYFVYSITNAKCIMPKKFTFTPKKQNILLKRKQETHNTKRRSQNANKKPRTRCTMHLVITSFHLISNLFLLGW